MLAPDTMIGGRYRLIRRIGAGGKADVWCAGDVMLNRRVALKFLLERYAEDEQFVERFRREAAAAAGLQHPNVVSVFDRGEHEGRPFIAMEFVEGASLKDLSDRGLSVGEAVEITRQVLSGARFAHARGIIHRDLKPQNVLVDREGRARVADFGIARAGVSEITQTGSVLGTAQYLSPEQAQGLDVTAASDLYSVGAMLYEALTGQVPFDADTAVAVALKQVSEAPRAPSEINPRVTPALDGVVLKALAKDPANRYQSADEFLAALTAAEADPSAAGGDTDSYAALAAPVAASPTAETQPPVPPEELPSEQEGFWTRNRLIAGGLILLALIGVGLYFLLHDSGTTQVPVPSVLKESEQQATSDLEAAGFVVVTSPVPNPAPVGKVLEQDPRAGVKADKGSTVTITVSTGPGKAKIPKDLRGLSLAEAEKELRKQGFGPFTVQRRFSSTVPDGNVISTDPGGGTVVIAGSPVTLVVSQGQNLVTVPSVVGEQQSQAQSEIANAHLHTQVTQQNSDSPEGEVLEQSPASGTQVKPRSTVVITVSTGAGSIVLPNVIGQLKPDAVDALKSRGVSSSQINVVKQDTEDQSMAGRVTDQQPPAGSRILATDQVTIFVGHFVAPPPPTDSTSSTPTTPKRR
jgi:beta-lactam-binding protein with PASTA domain/predicted Ser/Thr protein kinase